MGKPDVRPQERLTMATTTTTYHKDGSKSERTDYGKGASKTVTSRPSSDPVARAFGIRDIVQVTKTEKKK
jgi:hypothetical protein